jgi:hypothetical protein
MGTEMAISRTVAMTLRMIPSAQWIQPTGWTTAAIGGATICALGPLLPFLAGPGTPFGLSPLRTGLVALGVVLTSCAVASLIIPRYGALLDLAQLAVAGLAVTMIAAQWSREFLPLDTITLVKLGQMGIHVFLYDLGILLAIAGCVLQIVGSVVALNNRAGRT